MDAESRIRQLELEVRALRGALKASREAKLADVRVQMGSGKCQTCEGLRKLLSSATTVLEEKERDRMMLEQRIELLLRDRVAGTAESWFCDVCGQPNRDGFPRCTNLNCGSPQRSRSASPQLHQQVVFRTPATPNTFQQDEGPVRVVQCGMCRHSLIATSGTIVNCPNCDTRIAVPQLPG